jgi:hypothetical protein
MDLHFQSAAAIAQQIRDRKVSAAEALEHFLARVDKYNPRLNAVVWLDAARARACARAADAALARGDTAGPRSAASSSTRSAGSCRRRGSSDCGWVERDLKIQRISVLATRNPVSLYESVSWLRMAARRLPTGSKSHEPPRSTRPSVHVPAVQADPSAGAPA